MNSLGKQSIFFCLCFPVNESVDVFLFRFLILWWANCSVSNNWNCEIQFWSLRLSAAQDSVFLLRMKNQVCSVLFIFLLFLGMVHLSPLVFFIRGYYVHEFPFTPACFLHWRILCSRVSKCMIFSGFRFFFTYLLSCHSSRAAGICQSDCRISMPCFILNCYWNLKEWSSEALIAIF